MGKRILVIGSANVDFILRIPRFHKAGETILGEDAVTAFGGKGANQAVAAKRLGGTVDFLTTLGEDAQGKAYRKYLIRSGFKAKSLLTEPKKPTGMALIEIVPGGENRIIVSPGANGAFSPRCLKEAGQVWKGVGVLVVQLETPLKTVRAALDAGKRKGILTILNPAPARVLSSHILSLVDYLVPNEIEAQEIAGVKIKGEEGLSKAASELIRRGAKNVIITLGEKGAYFKNRLEELRVKAFRVKAVDTTAAGDAFVGTLAWGLAQGMDTENVLLHANAAGALTAARLGAQPSLPTIAEIRRFLRKRRNDNRTENRAG